MLMDILCAIESLDQSAEVNCALVCICVLNGGWVSSDGLGL